MHTGSYCMNIGVFRTDKSGIDMLIRCMSIGVRRLSIAVRWPSMIVRSLQPDKSCMQICVRFQTRKLIQLAISAFCHVGLNHAVYAVAVFPIL